MAQGRAQRWPPDPLLGRASLVMPRAGWQPHPWGFSQVRQEKNISKHKPCCRTRPAPMRCSWGAEELHGHCSRPRSIFRNFSREKESVRSSQGNAQRPAQPGRAPERAAQQLSPQRSIQERARQQLPAVASPATNHDAYASFSPILSQHTRG